MSGSLTIESVHKSYGAKKVLNGISFKAEVGEFLVLVGPSGCGKSTMLRSIAGLESISDGRIVIEDRDVAALPPKDRDIAMVFQDYALYPHKTVEENIAFGLEIRKVAKDEIKRRVSAAAEKLNLTSYLDRRPAALSGGQRQRVAIGRAIVRDPKVFLFDEPLSNLDAKLRGTMRVEIAKLHKELNATIVYVTHDQIEAMTLADRIIVLDSGHIQQIGTPLDLYYHPSNVFVATFIGSPPMNLLNGVLEKEGDSLKFRSNRGLQFQISPEHGAKLAGKVRHGQKVIWGLRAENFKTVDETSDGTRPVFEAEVVVTELLGPTTSVHCLIQGHEVNVMLGAPHRPKRGERLKLELASKHLYLFDEETEEALT